MGAAGAGGTPFCRASLWPQGMQRADAGSWPLPRFPKAVRGSGKTCQMLPAVANGP